MTAAIQSPPVPADLELEAGERKWSSRTAGSFASIVLTVASSPFPTARSFPALKLVT